MQQTTTGDDGQTVDNPHETAFPKSGEGRLLFWIAVAFSAFQIATAAHLIDMPSQVVRAVHVGFLALLAFPLIAAARNKPASVRALAWILAAAGVGVALYQWVEYTDLLLRAGDPLPRDIILGVIAIAIVFIAGWAMMGPALPVICGFFLAYCLFGQYLPSPRV